MIEVERMASQHGSRNSRAWSMLAVGFLILITGIPSVLNVYRQEWPDQGARPLILIASRGPGSPYSLDVQTTVGADGRYDFSIGFRSSVRPPASRDERGVVGFRITVVGRNLNAMLSCEGRSPVIMQAGALDRQTLSAIRVDRDAPVGSAMLASPNAIKQQPEYAAVTGKLEAAWPGESVAEGSVQRCSIEAPLLWTASRHDAPMNAVRSTFFAPEFNAFSQGGDASEFGGLAVSLWVQRAPGATIEEAFPNPGSDSAGWSLDLPVEERRPDQAASRIFIADQATWLFENRDGARGEQAMLLLGGMLLGLAISLVQGGLGRLLERTEHATGSAVAAETGP